VTFGEFKTLRPLRVLDLTILPIIPSLFDEAHYADRMPLIFMHRFVEDAAKPISKDGMEHIDYVPTQVVAEHFRHVFTLPKKKYLDGIRYRSSKSKNGICLALFCTQENCTDDLAATDKMLALESYNRKPSVGKSGLAKRRKKRPRER
jgi:hypothetical protein